MRGPSESQGQRRWWSGVARAICHGRRSRQDDYAVEPESSDAAVADSAKDRVVAHAELRESADYKAQITRLERVTRALIDIIRMSWAESSRSAPIVDGLLLYTSTDDTLESVVAILDLVKVGVHNAARRELRYLLESSVKHVYVDQQLPDVKTHSREDRIAYLASAVPRSSIDVVKQVDVLFGKPDDLSNYQNDVKSLWSRMSGYVHPSVAQTSRRLQRAERGAFIGFEDVKALRQIVDDIVKAYDMLGVMWLTGAGPSAAGDILTAFETPDWAFARTKWLPAMSRYYDYKSERKKST